MINLSGMIDVLFITSFFVLGAEWWERFADLFRYPGDPAAATTPGRVPAPAARTS